jgi:protein TonB
MAMKWMVTMLLLLCAYVGTAQKKQEKQKGKAEVFTQVEQMPEYLGGIDSLLKFLANNVIYPVKAQNEGTEGKVIMKFVVTKSGEIDDVQVFGSVSKELDEEATRVIKAMPKWVPGKQKGKRVAVSMTLPVSFEISD